MYKSKHLLAAVFVFAITISEALAEHEVTGLRADIYSETAAELFWDRIPGVTLQYEITRDDGVISITDGTSYFDPNRIPGVANTYTVTSIDSDGIRADGLTLTVGPFRQNLEVKHLRGDVYSATAAELFWIRDPGKNCIYEIVRSDGVTATTDGNSYYDDFREPGVLYTYEITAIDAEGNRSLPATIRLPAFGYESINSPQATGLRATVYSSTAAELHWDRVPNRNLRYEVLRDDGLTNITNGTSYYDNQRTPGKSNTYFIVTIDEEGNRSTAASIDVSGS